MIERDRTPFRYPLVPFGGGANKRLRTFAEVPGKVVRSGLELNLLGIEQDNYAAFQKGKTVFAELEDRYRIPYSGMDLVVGEEKEGEKKVFVLTDAIQGVPLLEALLHNPSDEVLGQTRQLSRSLIDYYCDKGVSGGDVWIDINDTQFVYGHRGAEKDRIYLVDLDPYISHFTSGAEAFEDIFYLQGCLRLGRFFVSLKKAAPQLDFRDIGQDMKNFLSTFPQNYRYRNIVEGAGLVFGSL